MARVVSVPLLTPLLGARTIVPETFEGCRQRKHRLWPPSVGHFWAAVPKAGLAGLWGVPMGMLLPKLNSSPKCSFGAGRPKSPHIRRPELMPATSLV
jgi:hypothetical protein